MLRVGVVGCKGKLGKEIIERISEYDGLELRRAITSLGSKYKGEKVRIGNDPTYDVMVEDDLMLCSDCDVLIDATTQKAFIEINYEKYASLKKPLIIATTGFNEYEMRKIYDLGEKIPVIQEANYSIELMFFVRALREYMKGNRCIDVSIFEAHHKQKKDKPSGTALYIRSEIEKVAPELEVEILSIRAGAIYGEHCVRIANLCGEEISFTHKVSSRKAFCDGILSIVPILETKKNGFYRMEDIL